MANSLGSLSQHEQFKIIYADKIGRYLAAASILQERFPFRETEQTGEFYQMPILTRRVSGGKYAAGGAGIITFNDIRTSRIRKAQLTGSQIFLNNGLEWEAAFSSQGSKKAYTSEFDLVTRDLMDTSRFRIELDTFWGQHAGGSVGTIDGLPATSATATVTIEAAELSPGILFNLEGHLIDIFASTLTTQRTSAIAVISPAYEILTVDPEAGTFTVDNSAGVIQDGDVAFLNGQRTTSAWNTQAGLHKWLSNTGTLANIDAAANVVWRPNIIPVGSLPLTFDKLLTLTARLLSRGHMGKLLAIVSVGAWNNMMSDMSAAVRRTPQERKYVLGASAIAFHTGAGEVEVIAHPYQKNGYAHVVPLMQDRPDGYTEDELDQAPVRRVGATDLVFVGSDGRGSEAGGQEFFYKYQGTNQLVMETYSHQALFVSSPCHTAALTGIVNA